MILDLILAGLLIYLWREHRDLCRYVDHIKRTQALDDARLAAVEKECFP